MLKPWPRSIDQLIWITIQNSNWKSNRISHRKNLAGKNKVSESKSICHRDISELMECLPHHFILVWSQVHGREISKVCQRWPPAVVTNLKNGSNPPTRVFPVGSRYCVTFTIYLRNNGCCLRWCDYLQLAREQTCKNLRFLDKFLHCKRRRRWFSRRGGGLTLSPSYGL